MRRWVTKKRDVKNGLRKRGVWYRLEARGKYRKGTWIGDFPLKAARAVFLF